MTTLPFLKSWLKKKYADTSQVSRSLVLTSHEIQILYTTTSCIYLPGYFRSSSCLLFLKQNSCSSFANHLLLIPAFLIQLVNYGKNLKSYLMNSLWGSPDGSVVKNLPIIQETKVQSLGWEDSPGGGNDNPLQSSSLGNSMDRGAWRAVVHGVTKSRTGLSNCTHILASPAVFHWSLNNIYFYSLNSLRHIYCPSESHQYNSISYHYLLRF